MTGLPLLIGKLALRNLEKFMIILRCPLVIAQVVVSGSPQKIATWIFRDKFGSRLKRLDRQLIILILVSGNGKVVIRIPEVGLQLHCRQQLLLSFGKLVL